MDKQELRNKFILNMEIARQKLGYTQAEFAEALDISMSGYKKMIGGETSSVSLYTAYQVERLSGVPIVKLLGMESEELIWQEKYQSLSERQKRYMRMMLELEVQIRPRENEEKFCMLLYPAGAMEDGMSFDSFHKEQINVGEYGTWYGSRLLFALQITGHCFSPVYVEGDVLLIANDRGPQIGEIGIFLNAGKLYMRRYAGANPMVLQPVAARGREICVLGSEIQNWYQVGYVLRKLR